MKEVVKRGHGTINRDEDSVIVFSAKERIDLRGSNSFSIEDG
jgi:hypothetical protein